MTTAKSAAPANRERKAALVLPTYSIKNVKTGDSLFVRIDTEIVNKADIDQKTGAQKLDKRGEPANLHLVQVTDMDSGERGEMVLPFIMHKAFEAAGALSGRSFELVKGREEKNKATMWEVYEIEG
jgi:hypothetical protein